MIFVNSLLSELNFTQQNPTVLHVDNQAAIMVAQSIYTGSHSKHIALKWHFLKQLVRDQQLELVWIETKSQLADILTKGLKT